MKAAAQLTTLEIASLAAGGDGVARANGLVVFTPRVAPGDVVEAEVAVEGRIGRGRLVQVVQPGASRVAPVCAHYAAPDRCGGCQWQHVDLAEQRAQKAAMVRDNFKRIARRDIPLPTVIGGEPWRYRRTLTLAIRKRGGGRVSATHIAGLRAFDDPEAVFDLHDCPITAEPVLAAWREILAAAQHLPNVSRLRGTVRYVNDRAHFTLEGGRDWPRVQAFLDAVPSIAAIWWHVDGGRRRLVADRRPANEPGASFAQVNPEIASQMQAEVVRRVLAYQPRTVIDAYSGSGATAVELARRGVSVVAIEADEDATAYATQQLTAFTTENTEEQRRGLRGSPVPSVVQAVAVAARVEDVIHKHLPADVVILNPPRAGVDAKVTAALVKAHPAPKAIIYVSCDPATLARDVARLPGWGIHDLTCYDMFPQTSHVESVLELRPEGRA